MSFRSFYRHNRVWFLPAVVFLALVVGAGLLWTLKPRIGKVYHRIRSDMYLASAEKFLAAKDYASAKIQLQNAIRHDFTRGDAWVKMAAVFRAEGNADHVVVLMRAFELDPAREDVAISLLRACAETRRVDVANVVLPKILQKFDRNSEVWHLGGVLLLTQQRYREGYQALLKARELAPDDSRVRVSVATLELVANDPAVAERGRKALEDLRSKPEFFAAATQSLAEAASARDPKKAIQLWTEMIERDPENWTAKVKRLDLVRKGDAAEGDREIENLWKTAKSVQQRMDLITRRASWTGAADGEKLLDKLPPEERRRQEVRLLEIALKAQQNKWPDVARLAKEEAEKLQVPDEQRLNFWLWLARAQRSQKDESTARMSLRGAEQIAVKNAQLAFLAADLLERWGMGDVALPFFDAAVSSAANNQVRLLALTRLIRQYEGKRDTAKILECYEKLLEVMPANLLVKNNVASLLLWVGRDRERAVKMAQEVYEARPSEPAVADTYARALAAEGRAADAIVIYEKLPGQAMQQPALRVAYADALVRAGRAADAAVQLANLDASSLLPEQQKLAEKLHGTK